MLGAYIIRYPRSRIRALFAVIPLSLPAWLLLGFWFVLQFFSGLGSLGEVGANGRITSGGVAYFAHIGGFLAGALLMAVFNLFGEE